MQEKAVYKVALDYETDMSKTYQLLCNCSDPRHNWTVDIELNKEWGVQLTIYGDMYYYPNYSYGKFLCDLRNRITNYWRRLGAVIRLLFTGYLEMNTDLMIIDEKHLNSFIGILEEGRDYCYQKKINIEKHRASIFQRKEDPADAEVSKGRSSKDS